MMISCQEGPVNAMPFEIIRNDIVHMKADAIVNTANPKPIIGSGTDAAIHRKAGPSLLEARKAIGPIKPGTCAITPAFGLDARYVIHAVGPVWRGGLLGEAKLLRNCYTAALQLAREHRCRSIVFPLISTGTYGFPKDKGLQIAISAFSEFLLEHEMQIYLAVWDREAFRLSENLFQSIASFIDEHYVQKQTIREYSAGYASFSREQLYEEPEMQIRAGCNAPECRAPRSFRPTAAPKQMSLEEMLENTDAGFTETLLKLIDRTGKKDSVIYKKANLSKQHFSKIRNNPDYQPTKSTAIALALALELNLEQTRDLIGRAGFTLTDSSKFDIIIRYFIEHKQYDLMEINMALYEFDQSLLGS